MHKEFHSTPELCWEQENGELMTCSWAPDQEHQDQPDAPSSDTSPQSAEDWRKSQSQDDVYCLEMEAQNKRNARRSWSVAAPGKKKPPLPPPGGSRYHGSWQNIEHSYRPPEDGDEDEETEEEDDDGEDEDAATPVADQLTLLGGSGDYRAVKPCRPVYSSSTLPKRASSPHCTAPPPNHPPPPPPPPSQMVRVDLTKSHSEYAVTAGGDPARPTTPVMSSFRPADNAKLYALPEDAKSVGYMTLRPTSSSKKPASPAPPASAGSSPSSSAAARSKSLPPRSVRPNVAVKSATGSPTKQQHEEPRVNVIVNSTPLIPDPDYDSDEEIHHKNNNHTAEIYARHPIQQQHPPTRVRIEINQQPPSSPPGGLPKSQSFCADILKAKSQLKTSQSFPEELSDCQQQQQQPPPPQDAEDAYVTFVPVNNGKQSDTVPDHQAARNASHVGGGGGGSGGARRVQTHGNLTRHAVSLIQLPPPVENGESDQDERAHHSMDMAAEQDSVSTVSTLSSLSSNSSDRDTTTVVENKPMAGKKVTINGHWREEQSTVAKQRPNSTTDAERTIEESLQLIRRHVDELSGMNHRPTRKSPPGVPPPPQFEPPSGCRDVADGGDMFLPPPPPEFSDHHHTSGYGYQMSRTLPKSMSSGQLRGTLGDADDVTSASSSSHFLNRRVIERRLSDDAVVGLSTTTAAAGNRQSTVRVVATVPKKVTFSSDVIDAETSRGMNQAPPQPAMMTMRHFSSKPLEEWTIHDTADWLDSLFLNEYKTTFMKRNIDGNQLLRINNELLMNLGVKRLGHRLNMEKSLKHYARIPG